MSITQQVRDYDAKLAEKERSTKEMSERFIGVVLTFMLRRDEGRPGSMGGTSFIGCSGSRLLPFGGLLSLLPDKRAAGKGEHHESC
jgi:hypothetical protein